MHAVQVCARLTAVMAAMLVVAIVAVGVASDADVSVCQNDYGFDCEYPLVCPSSC